MEKTLIFFISDNGRPSGAHRARWKPCEYEECTKVPFWVRDPTAVSRSEPHLVSNVDLASTFAELAGATPTIAQDGRSLVPMLGGPVATWRKGVLLEWLGETAPRKQTDAPPFWAVRTRRYKYVELVTGEKELYDLLVDPFELENLAGRPSYSEVESRLAAHLVRLKQ